MSAISAFRSVGNEIYKYAFPIYHLCYRTFKIYADRAERRLLQEILSPGATVVDIGANVGIYSEFLARCVGPTGMVHSFEPSFENFKRLRAATRKLHNVRTIQAAVGERSGESKLYVSDKLNVDHRAYASQDSRRAVSIEMVALDDYFKPGERVDLIKMDIQGYELHALHGSNRVLADNPGIKLLFEFWPYGLKQAGTRGTELMATLQRKNMIIFQVKPGGLEPFLIESASDDADWYVNLFATRESLPTEALSTSFSRRGC